jgi:hypothetical protein
MVAENAATCTAASSPFLKKRRFLRLHTIYLENRAVLRANVPFLCDPRALIRKSSDITVRRDDSAGGGEWIIALCASD